MPTLEVEAIHTGNSVKFKFGEGWLPKISNDKENDIVIQVPKKLGIPVLIGALLLGTAREISGLRNDLLDAKIKELDIKIKQAELQKIIEGNEEKRRALQISAAHFVDRIRQNPDIKEFRVYDINILPNSADKSRRDRPSNEK